jgi:hypothetical protein
LDTNGLLDEAIFRYHATQQELQAIAEGNVAVIPEGDDAFAISKNFV